MALGVPGRPVTSVGVLYGAVAFRASYSSWQRAMTDVAVFLAAFSVGLAPDARRLNAFQSTL